MEKVVTEWRASRDSHFEYETMRSACIRWCLGLNILVKVYSAVLFTMTAVCEAVLGDRFNSLYSTMETDGR